MNDKYRVKKAVWYLIIALMIIIIVALLPSVFGGAQKITNPVVNSVEETEYYLPPVEYQSPTERHTITIPDDIRRSPGVGGEFDTGLKRSPHSFGYPRLRVD